MVEAQGLISTRKLTDTLDDHEILEELIEASKPTVPIEAVSSDYLLFTPFRYPPRKHGSRFRRRTQNGIWYGSDVLGTAFAEAAYYRLLFVADTTADLGFHEVSCTVFQAEVRTDRGADLSRPPFDQYRSRISSKTEYADAQTMGSEMQQQRVEAVRYFSARDLNDGTNIAVFSPVAFAKRTVGPWQTWHCTVTRSTVEFQRDLVKASRFVFNLVDYLVDGQLPSAAT